MIRVEVWEKNPSDSGLESHSVKEVMEWPSGAPIPRKGEYFSSSRDNRSYGRIVESVVWFVKDGALNRIELIVGF